jgi:erythromycin esterase
MRGFLITLHLPIAIGAVVSHFWHTCLVVALALTSSELRAQAAGTPSVPSAVMEWGRTHVRPISPDNDTVSNTADLVSFKNLIGDARVIGLGEAEHGIHELFAFRNRFLKFAVESLGVTAIAVETGYTESTAVDDYVLGGGELNPAIVASVFSWSSGVAYAENQALLQWIRNYNARPTVKRKVHFYGVDLTGGRAGRFVEGRHAIDSALAYVALAEPKQERALRAHLEQLEPSFTSGLYDSLTAEKKDTLTAAIDDLVSLFERRAATWPVITSREAFDRAYRSAIVSRQLNANFRAAQAESNPQAQRESAMADNLAWVLQQEEPRGRILLYEANWHISKGPMASDRWGTSLGEHMKSLLGSDYVAIATSFGEKRTASDKTSEVSGPDPTSAAALLSRSCTSPCWLSVREVPNQGPITEWFNTMRPIQGGRVDQMWVSRAFDALVFIPSVQSARTK